MQHIQLWKGLYQQYINIENSNKLINKILSIQEKNKKIFERGTSQKRLSNNQYTYKKKTHKTWSTTLVNKKMQVKTMNCYYVPITWLWIKKQYHVLARMWNNKNSSSSRLVYQLYRFAKQLVSSTKSEP